jgi:hypothetical protein
MADELTDDQIQAIAESGADAFARDVYGRSGFDHVMDEAGYHERDDPDAENVYVEEMRPEWVGIARGIVTATMQALRGQW